ncbi:MAG: DNA polymerase III subunit gamma/tau [Arsenophonus sp.]|nr:MAG: DNA polymerase III subunit gamma/tau [Arsenophonus sp.]
MSKLDKILSKNKTLFKLNFFNNMTYEILARKWRPKKFDDIIGQNQILNALKNSLDRKRLHHAYLFSGTRGVGKTTITRIFAKALNCTTGITKNPCNQCINCIEIQECKSMDVIEIDGASRSKVEDIRELLDNAQYKTNTSRFKIYLIDEVHMLSRYSFNALLKILEEPPKHIKFLLATTEPEKIPETILSRCLQLHLNVINTKQITEQIKYITNKEKIIIDELSCETISYHAKGSLRDALTLLEQCIMVSKDNTISYEIISNILGILKDEEVLTIIESIVKNNGNKMMELIEKLYLKNFNLENILISISSILHRIAIMQIIPIIIKKNTSKIEQKLHQLTKIIDPHDLQKYYQIMLMGRKELPFAPEEKIGIEMVLLRALQHSTNIKKQTITKKDVYETTLKISKPKTYNKKKINEKIDELEKQIKIKNQIKQDKYNFKKKTFIIKSDLKNTNNFFKKHLINSNQSSNKKILNEKKQNLITSEFSLRLQNIQKIQEIIKKNLEIKMICDFFDINIENIRI